MLKEQKREGAATKKKRHAAWRLRGINEERENWKKRREEKKVNRLLIAKTSVGVWSAGSPKGSQQRRSKLSSERRTGRITRGNEGWRGNKETRK